MVETKIKTKNIIVEYKGGGYDGCFWEWNFFLFDSNGEFHNLYSSGRNGVKDETEALEMIKDEESGASIYNLDNHEEMDHFQAGINAGNLHALMQKVNEEIDCPEIWYKCPCCENEVNEVVLDPDNYCGNGGIGVEYHGLYCPDCFSNGACSECGSFDEKLIENGGEFCEYCLESKVKDYIKDLELNGGIFLEFNHHENKWTEIDDLEIEPDDLESDEPLFKITLKRSIGIIDYFLNGKDEKSALSDLLNHIENDYYQVNEIEKLTVDSIEFD